MELPYAEPYKIKVVESLQKSSLSEREKCLEESGYNLFKLQSENVFIDLLTDSGTGAMSDLQWSEIMKGDESYAGSKTYYKLLNVINKLFDMPYFLPTHQGRAAENVLFSAIVNKGDVIPGNSHFDTTKGHIEFRNATAIDCTIDEANDTSAFYPFKGNIDLQKLEDIFKKYPREIIPLCIITITNNTSGGQPVSMQNIRETSELCKKYGIRLIFDAARFAENAYFIKIREEKHKNTPIREIIKEMFSYVDGATMSCKKDGIVNIGGFIAFRDKDLFEKASIYNIMFEGYITYGGMAGRDLGALAQGLWEGSEFLYLESRVKQVEYLAKKLRDHGIPLQEPTGGHAVFVDAKKFLPKMPKEQFQAHTLSIELYREGGVRGLEIGALLANRDPITRENRYPELELLRLAIPRRVYTNNHMDYVAACLANVFDRRDKLTTGYKIVKEAPFLRHFTVELKKI